MRNLITRKELEEQFGQLLLEFDFFCGNTFAFSGYDRNSGCWITMFVKTTNMSFVGAKSSTSIMNAIQHQNNGVRFLVLDRDLQIIYED